MVIVVDDYALNKENFEVVELGQIVELNQTDGICPFLKS